jgi:hypothetical protein
MNHNIIYLTRTYAQLSRSLIYDYLPISSTPKEEKCVQIGDQLLEDNKLECAVYINQLIRQYGEPVGDAEYLIMSNDREGLIYYEAIIRYHSNDDAAVKYALEAQDGCKHWDDTSKQQLKAAGYSLLSAPVIKLRRRA